MSQIQDHLNIVLYSEYKPSIQTLMEQKHYGTALTLIFSCIDMLAHICRPRDHNRASRSDYIKWVNTFFSFHDIPGEYMYSARCALIHSFGVESDSTRKSKAPQIGFCSGGNKPIIYRPEINKDLMLIEIVAFCQEFYKALDRFYLRVYSDPEQRKLIEPRTEQLLQSFPVEKLKEEFVDGTD